MPRPRCAAQQFMNDRSRYDFTKSRLATQVCYITRADIYGSYSPFAMHSLMDDRCGRSFHVDRHPQALFAAR